MEQIICLILCALIVVLLRFIFKINLKKVKELEQNKELQKITDRFPENIEIAKEMLNISDNKKVKIEEVKDTKTSLYIAVTNKILIADLKNNYGRIQTIAHECLHSVQDRTLLMFNFVVSNITIAYWIITMILIMSNIFKNVLFHIFTLLLLLFIQTMVRAYLEIDAIIKSKFLAKEYIESKKLCTEKEINELVSQYEKINNLGISFYMYKLISTSLIKIIFVILIKFIVMLL